MNARPDRVNETGIGCLFLLLPAAAGAMMGRLAGGSWASATLGAITGLAIGAAIYLLVAAS